MLRSAVKEGMEQVDDKAQVAFFPAHLFVDLQAFRPPCSPVPLSPNFLIH